MPTSSESGKICVAEEINWISKRFPLANILDIGAGQGTYSKKFRQQFPTSNWIAVEVWQPYIDQYRLESLYNQVIALDAREVDYAGLSFQDLVIAGDVLEHMEKEEAVNLVDSILDHHRLLIISIPVIHMPQDAVFGNPYERHIKDDWTDSEIKSAFKDIVYSIVDNEIGIYILSKDPKVILEYQLRRKNTFLREKEKKVFSQNGEDGILEAIFAEIGTVNKIAVEIGVADGGSGREANTRFLAENGWQCYWFDAQSIEQTYPNVHFTQKFLTASNVKEVFNSLNIPREFDILSIDIDGNDYYLREALKEYSPRICVLEYNGSFVSREKYIMPKNDSYRWQLWHTDFGASLRAFYEQAQSLGYALVYCESRGVNVFFIRQDLNPWAACEPEDVWNKLWWAR
jgi:hypothetical protein